ncbi:hypothetical protein [Falsibacillus albus]|uniref:hypothetical protein n=1 Tax=Falsibacillus albus TaxID=2478915 RepID=UPI0013141036|nr:hypothetical protein [Falsibacillus albus]
MNKNFLGTLSILFGEIFLVLYLSLKVPTSLNTVFLVVSLVLNISGFLLILKSVKTS